MEIRQKLDYLKRNKLHIFYKILIVISSFILMYALNKVTIFGSFNLFGFSFLFALIWCEKNAIWCGLIFSLSFYLASLKTIDGYIAIFLFIVSICAFFLNNIKRNSYKNILPYFLCAISFIPYAYFYSGSLKANITLIISMLFSLMFLYICKYFLKGTILRGFNSRLNIDEKICGGILLALISYGFNSIEIFNLEFATLFCVLLVLFSTYVLENLETIVIAFICGLVVSINTFNPIFIAYFVCFAIFSTVFKTRFKIFSSVAVILVHLIFTLYFDNYMIFHLNTLIAVVIISTLFLLIPNKFLRYLKDVFAGSKDKIAIRNLVKESKNKITKRLVEISKVFKEMEYTFKRTLQRTLPLSEKKDMMKQDLVDSLNNMIEENIYPEKLWG